MKDYEVTISRTEYATIKVQADCHDKAIVRALDKVDDAVFDTHEYPLQVDGVVEIPICSVP